MICFQIITLAARKKKNGNVVRLKRSKIGENRSSIASKNQNEETKDFLTVVEGVDEKKNHLERSF